MRKAALVVLLCWSATTHADPRPAWYEGHRGRLRLAHIGVAAGFGLAYFVSGALLKAPQDCRWCDPPAYDRALRNAIVWKDTARADSLSTIDAYVVAPLVGFGLLLAVDYNAGTSRILDDIIPVAETVAITVTVVHLIKVAVGRRRPYAEFGDPDQPTNLDDNASFVSGHSALGFSITAAAGTICHWRHYRTEPYVWATGIVLSLSTEYLRMAADQHYLTDVVAGGAVGLTAGLLIPRMMREDIKIVPVKNGVALAGAF